jgi:hypothetical protein
MADEISKVDKKKDETSGIGGIDTLIGVGLGAAAMFPFFRAFRNTSKVKDALKTIESQTGQKNCQSSSRRRSGYACGCKQIRRSNKG